MIDINKEDDILAAIELLYFGYRAFTNGPDELLAKRGLNRSHHRILYFIARQDGQSVGQLLQTLDISKQALNTPLRQLTAMGLVKSRKNAEDARVRELRLTADGKKLEKQLTRTQRGLLQEVLVSAGPTAAQGWKKVMRHLANCND